MKSKSQMTKVLVWSVFPIALVVLSLQPGRAQAATFVVNSTADVVDAAPGNGSCATAAGVCTLRAAIQEANALTGADTITLPAGTYILSIPGPYEDFGATGDLDITDDLTINGAGAVTTIINGGGIDRVLEIPFTNTATVSDVTITGSIDGIGVGSFYGGLPSMLTLNRSTVSGNTVYGILKTGTVILNNSTVSGNSGTGILNYSGDLTLNNSTVSGNGNGGPYVGGIVTTAYPAAITLNNSTVSGNIHRGLLIGMQGGGAVTLKNTILANLLNCDFPNQDAALISLGHNLSSDPSCQSSGSGGPIVIGGLNQPNDLNNTPAQLAPLFLNPPGNTKTHALCTGPGMPHPSCGAVPSPAIDKGGDCLAVDQRGVPRPQGAGCDIGAYEVGSAPPVAACATPPPNMVAWWPMDETSGTTVIDRVGSHNGTARPAPIGAFAGPGPVTSSLWPPPTLPVGMVNNSLFFRGDRRVEIPSHTDLEPGTGDFTIDAWVNYAASGNGQFLTVARKALGNGGTQTTAPLGFPGGIGYEMVIQDYSPGQGILSFTMQGAGLGNLGTGGPYITPNTWHHVAFTLQRTSTAATITIYLDGSSTGSTLTTPWTYGNISNTWNLLIGGDGVLAGNIAVDEVEIFDRALSQSEIQAIFKAGSAGKCKTAVSPNKPPLPNAGPDQTLEATGPSGASVSLNGSGSSDPDSNTLTYNWTGPFGTLSGVSHTVTLPLGAHTVTLTVNDGQATATDTVSITVRDTTPPDTMINSAVDGKGTAVASGGSTLSNSITFTFGGTDVVGVAGFQCSRDGSVYAACSSPLSYSALTIGSHTFQVRALDAAGNVDTSPASFTWTVITPAQAIENLITTINNMGLAGGVATSLTAPLNNINTNNKAAACGKLNAFINQVNTKLQNGQLTSAQGSQLLQAANAIKASLGC